MWWLPNASEDRVFGILDFDPNKGATLSLMGSLKGIEGFVDFFEPEIILGLSPDGKQITLRDCAQTLGNMRFGRGFSTSTFVAGTIFVGEHFERCEDIEFERLVVEYLNAEAWADATGFQISFIEEKEDPERRWTEIKHELPETFTTVVGDKYEVVLNFGSDFEASQRPFTWAKINQPAEFIIRFSDKQSFDYLSEITFRLQHLLSLGMRRSAHPVSIRGYTGMPNEAMPVEVFYRPLGKMDGVKRPERFEMLFSRKDLPGGFESAVANWLEKAGNLDPVYRLFLGTVYNPHSYLEQRFLSLVQALEVYHRRALQVPEMPKEEQERRVREILNASPEEHKSWLKRKLQVVSEPSLDQRLHEIFKRHLSIVESLISNKKQVRAEFIEKVVVTRTYLINGSRGVFGALRSTVSGGCSPIYADSLWACSVLDRLCGIYEMASRNYRTHFDDSKKDKAARGEDLYQIMRKLNLLLEACLMEEIGFDPEKTRKAVLSIR